MCIFSSPLAMESIIHNDQILFGPNHLVFSLERAFEHCKGRRGHHSVFSGWFWFHCLGQLDCDIVVSAWQWLAQNPTKHGGYGNFLTSWVRGIGLKSCLPSCWQCGLEKDHFHCQQNGGEVDGYGADFFVSTKEWFL